MGEWTSQSPCGERHEAQPLGHLHHRRHHSLAILVGLYMRNLRPGRVLEGTLIGVTLLILAVAGGGWLDHQEGLRSWFDFDVPQLAVLVILYGFTAAVLTIVFLVTTWVLVADTLRISYRVVIGGKHPPSSEAPHVPTRLAQEWMRD